MNLREDLARRLRTIQEQASPAGYDIDGIPTRWTPFDEIEPDSECGKILRAQADECIRQMEWARRESPLTELPHETPEGLLEITWSLLTLAPKDWKP